jgi:hypothetical protein
MTGQNNEAQWYIAREGKQHGPLTDVEMRTFVAHSYLRPTDLIWRPGMPDWQPAPTVFPAVFQPPASAPGPAVTQPTQTSLPAGLAQAISTPHSSDFDSDSDARSAPKRSFARKAVLASLLVALVGGGAAGLTLYREPLMKLLPVSTGAPAARTQVAASQKPAETPQTAAEVKTAALTPPAPSVPPAAAGSVAVASPEGTATDARLQKVPVWSLIKKEYPEWYANQVAAAEKLVAENKSEADVAAQLAFGLSTLRRQNSEKALAAGPDKLKRMATAFLENLKTLRTASIGACYGFISKGETSPAVIELLQKPETATSFNAQAEAIMQAVLEGGKTPAKHEPAVKTDYEMLIKELGKLGWKDEDLQVFSNPRALAKREPEQVCQMVQDWFVAHLAIGDAAAQERLLYETLKPVVQG